MTNPVAAAVALSLLWQTASINTAKTFARHNQADAEKIVRQEVRDFNACLENARQSVCMGNCPQANNWDLFNGVSQTQQQGACWAQDLHDVMANTGKNATLERYLACSPRVCKDKLGVVTTQLVYGSGSVPSEYKLELSVPHRTPAHNFYEVFDDLLLNTTKHVDFLGTSLRVKDYSFDEWQRSQSVANIAVACDFFGNFDNVSIYMYNNNYTISTKYWLTAHPLVYFRYNKAVQLVSAASGLRNTPRFCSVLDEFVRNENNVFI